MKIAKLPTSRVQNNGAHVRTNSRPTVKAEPAEIQATKIVKSIGLEIVTTHLTLVGDTPLIVHEFGFKERERMRDAQQGKSSRGRSKKNPLDNERGKPGSVLAKYFTEDESIAARKCWINEAQAVLQSIHVFVEDKPAMKSQRYSVYLHATPKLPAMRTTLPKVLSSSTSQTA